MGQFTERYYLALKMNAFKNWQSCYWMQSENTEKMRNKKPDDWGTAVTQSHECTHTREAGVWQFQGFHHAFVRFSPPSPLPPYREKIKPFPQGNHWSLCYLRALIITGGVNKWVDAKIQLGLVFKHAVALTVFQPVTIFLHYICDGAEVKPFQ